MMGAGTCGNADIERVAEIPSLMRELQDAIDGIGVEVEKLASKITPVLQRPQPQDPQPCKPPNPQRRIPSTIVGEQVEVLIGTARVISRLAAEIREKVEL